MTGYVLHFGADHRKPGTAHLFHPRLNPHFEFDTEFDKTLKNQCFSPFPHHQKSPYITQKSTQTLVKSTFLRTHPKITKFHPSKHHPKYSHQPISSIKIKHFPQSNHLKITLSPNPSKFTSQIQTSHTQLRPKFGIWSGFYLPAKIHNIKKHIHN